MMAEGQATASKHTASKDGWGIVGTVRHYVFGNSKDESKEEFRFLMLGKTGSGKSTTGNTILGEPKFASAMMFSSMTTDCDLQRVDKNGKIIEIMDCPGLYDTQQTQEAISTTIVRAVACTHPGPHAILYIIRLGRYTAEEFGVFQQLKALFDDDITKYMIVLFTGGDDLEREGRTLADLLENAPKELIQVVDECGNRCHVFNNNAKNKNYQVEKLLQEVRRMQKANEHQPYYNCPKFALIGEGLEKEVRRRLAEVEKTDLARETYIQELEARTKEATKAIANVKAKLQKKEEKRLLLEKEEKEERIKREKHLLQDLEAQKHLSEENRKMKERELQEQLNADRSRFMELMKEERKKDREQLGQREKEREKMEERRRQEEKEEQNERESVYREELNRMKDDIAQNQEEGWIDWAAKGVASVLAAPFKAVASFFS